MGLDRLDLRALAFHEVNRLTGEDTNMRSVCVVVTVFLLGASLVANGCTGGGGTIGADDGGTSSSSSSSSSSGFITDGGPGNCSPVTFQFTVNSSAQFCAGAGSCDATWLVVQKADKSPASIAAGCVAQCGACQEIGCPANCPQPNPVPKEGLTQQWDGRLFTTMTCQSAEGRGLSCAEPSCAPNGKYVARMCAFAAADAGAPPNGCGRNPTAAEQICTEVEFELPATGPVVGTISP